MQMAKLPVLMYLVEPNRIIGEVEDKNSTDRPIDDRADRSPVKIYTDPNRSKFEAKSPYSLWGSRSSVSATEPFIPGCIMPFFRSFPFLMTEVRTEVRTAL
ncbi:hypothetical protein [Laspinema palackyanum]|uniref:hypothetical protein n=1 Tax=Laspinema palackyanum TaxID=3231601 RepID=UPI00345C7D0B